MGITIKPSDLKYKYPRVVATRNEAKLQGKDDPAPFDRDDLYDILAMLEAVMDDLGSNDAQVLHLIEDLMNRELPRSFTTRGEVFRYLAGTTRDFLEL
ncbi:hypothetical protein GMST_38620 [Geomonas silvestris]|uniref:Uncharacterized protein n=1 Tax=Geomonas silvestris TaxID=2740184 RepID=A0A6V8MNT1_9BACT|nr:hypothetical protein [Geomonas silvestris]GFO61537.1 hypothetical protein GMST_38620 [Geomonas silvestris]